MTNNGGLKRLLVIDPKALHRSSFLRNRYQVRHRNSTVAPIPGVNVFSNSNRGHVGERNLKWRNV